MVFFFFFTKTLKCSSTKISEALILISCSNYRLVVLVQASSLLGHKRKSDTDEILPTSDEEMKLLLREDTLANDFDKKIDELNREFDTVSINFNFMIFIKKYLTNLLFNFFQSSWLLSINLGWEGGVHVQTCGHHLHMDCLRAYLQSLRGQQRQQSLAVDR